jgi:hypothetical protein
MPKGAAKDVDDYMLHSTAGMYGDLQGIAGKSLQEIEGLELKALEVDNNTSQKFLES